MTVAVLTAAPTATGWTWMDTVAVAPLAMDNSGQVTVGKAVVLHTESVEGIALTSVTPGGSVSVTTTPVASDGPLLVTVTV